MNPRSGGSLVVGESLVDILVDSSGMESTFPGGSPLNVAVGLARLGWPTALLTRVGCDASGELIESHLAASGVSLWPGSTVSQKTSSARAIVDDLGHALYQFDLDWSVPYVKPTGVSHIHTGSIGAIVQPGADAVLKMFGRKDAHTLKSFDPNVRPALMGERAVVVARVETLARNCHVVKMSDEDADWLYPGMAHSTISQRYLEFGVALFAITRGSDGVFLTSADVELSLPAVPVNLIDTIGAGDAFMSGLLYAILADGMDRLVLAGRLGAAEVEHVGTVALASAALTVTRAGASPPTIEELESLLPTRSSADAAASEAGRPSAQN
jgi:fructokinase